LTAKLTTYHLRRYVNELVEATAHSPSLAEMLREHLEVDYDRQTAEPYHVWYAVHDRRERWLTLDVVDARGYPNDLYRRGHALLRVAVNGALASPEDEAFLRTVFGERPFRTCRRCGYRAADWLDYYGHLKLAHWTSDAPDSA
jgi:hypothetical protein